MRKIRTLLLFSALFIGTTSFGETYSGEGDETEIGVQTCDMTIQDVGPASMVTMRALGQEVSTLVLGGDDVNFKTQLESDAKYTADGTEQTGTLKITASGKIKNGKPVAYRLTVEAADALMGNDTETVNCKF
jgi:hypothetical protein